MDKLKKLAKALAKERNIPYQTAHNILTGHGSRVAAPAVLDEAKRRTTPCIGSKR